MPRMPFRLGCGPPALTKRGQTRVGQQVPLLSLQISQSGRTAVSLDYAGVLPTKEGTNATTLPREA